MPLVINGLRGGDTQTDRQTHTYTHIPKREPKQFQETRCTLACGRHEPGLKMGIGIKVKSMQTSYRSKKYKLNIWSSVITEQRDKQNINSKAFAILILTACYLINHYKPDAVRIGIANALELIFCLSLRSMITELHL